MKEGPEGALAQIPLQSKDHEEPLDVVDSLRSYIGHHIDLPQLIVCGDKSSGKSCVLEAISGLCFPTNSVLCTRFATELILRRSPKTNILATIITGDDRSAFEKETSETWKCNLFELSEFALIVDLAQRAIGLTSRKNSAPTRKNASSSDRAISSDVVRVEMTGTKQPHLTLVDLPGLFHSSTKKRTAEDPAVATVLTNAYMGKPRSIILAAVSANNDFANQIVVKNAREFDPSKTRTLGIHHEAG
jgi:hypothetical protein